MDDEIKKKKKSRRENVFLTMTIDTKKLTKTKSERRKIGAADCGQQEKEKKKRSEVRFLVESRILI